MVANLGSLKIEDDDFAVNEDFRQQAIQVADALDLDEVDSAKLFFDALQDAESLDRPPLACSIFLFHELRQYSLECLRLLFHKASDEEIDDEISDGLKNFISLLLQTDNGRPESGSTFWQRCIDQMTDVERKLHHITDRVHTISMTDQGQAPEFAELMEFQRSSLVTQHASLGAIAYWLVKANHLNLEDLRYLMTRLRLFERYDVILVHYLPCLFHSLLRFGSTESPCPAEDARSLHETILSRKDSDAWSLRNLHAAVVAVWLAEYSARTIDDVSDVPENADDSGPGAQTLAARYVEALNDGALRFLLAVSHDVKDSEWVDPARQGFVTYLVQDTPNLQTDPLKVADFLADLLLEQNQLFVESFITNMPDTLRTLRFEEDEQRTQMHAMVQLRSPEYDIHFERFLLVVACAFEGFPDAAERFWTEPDSPLYGFLDWASQRQSTPRVAAFCEMLSALAEGQECADGAHRFLLEDTSRAAAKFRRSSSLNWSHIFKELEFYSLTIRDRPVQAGSRTYGARSQSDQFVEPESAMMLESYLRLLTRLCKESPAARAWLLTLSSFHVHEHLLQLCSSSIESRLRACAFTALASLLTDKDREINDGLWTALDAWVSGSASFAFGLARPTNLQMSSAQSERMILESISQGFEEPNSFVGLLQGLVEPIQKFHFLKDSLPFPETMGSAYKIPGIEPYVDFVLGLVFAPKSKELHDPLQLRIMRFNCLGFALSCLSTFNEELVVLANRSSIAVDSAIQVSSLDVYARIHPFARTMEWFFNDNVISALFGTACQNVKEVAVAPADSPLVLSLVRSIEVIDLILTQQSTYFEIVRPLIKLQSNNRRPNVANSALASFEDAILSHLPFVTNLALYCGSGHDHLVNASLKLLQKVSASRKLATPLSGSTRRQSERNRLITQLDQDQEGENVSRSLVSEMQFNERELEQGQQCPGYIMKSQILVFLKSSLDTTPNRPTIAHLLLGFSCGTASLDLMADGLFALGGSLFHGIVAFLVDCPFTDGDTFAGWLISIRNSAWQVMKRLWQSSLSSTLVMAELRAQDFFFAQALRQCSLASSTTWDDRPTSDPDFYVSSSAEACCNFLEARSAFLDHSAVELRLANEQGLASLISRMQSTLFGLSRLPSGESITNQSVFDFLDFLDIDVAGDWRLPESRYFDTSILRICVDHASEPEAYDLDIVTQLLTLRQNEIRQSSRALTIEDEQQMDSEIGRIYQCLQANNNQVAICAARVECLKSWVRLVTVMLECCQFEPAARTAFVLQLLEISLPRLDRLINSDIGMAAIFSRFVRSLMHHFDFATSSSLDRAASELADDKLLQLYRICLTAIQNADTTADLQETCCQICQAYLRGISEDEKQRTSRRHALQSITLIGSRLIEVLCEDALAGEGQSRLSSLTLLDGIVTVSNQEHSKDIITLFNKINFVQVMVSNIANIPSELQDASGEGECTGLTTFDLSNQLQAIPLVLSHHDASLTLLRTIAQTRLGAAQVSSSGLFSSIRDSGVFSADPDIGLGKPSLHFPQDYHSKLTTTDANNPLALTKYFSLMLQLTRIINSVVLSRGPENDQTIAQARRFVHEHRPAVVGLFKRNAHIGTVAQDNEEVVAELVDNFVVLMAAVGFLEVSGSWSSPDPPAPLTCLCICIVPWCPIRLLRERLLTLSAERR